MAALTWDKSGDHFFQAGVDRGVLYLHDGTVAVWNGLLAVEENSAGEGASYYLDGVKYLEKLAPGDFQGSLRALTYPDEFDEVNGVHTIAPGLSYYDQPPQSFNLSYRTMIGNDLEGIDYAYKIHLLYNVIATPQVYGFDTLSDPLRAAEFGWTLSGMPPMIKGHRPTVHVTVDSLKTDPGILQQVEEWLYGSDVSDPHFPPINDIAAIFGSLGALIIIDNGDGTWTAIDESNNYISMLDSTTFQIENADATYLDATTYTISTTNPE